MSNLRTQSYTCRSWGIHIFFSTAARQKEFENVTFSKFQQSNVFHLLEPAEKIRNKLRPCFLRHLSFLFTDERHYSRNFTGMPDLPTQSGIYLFIGPGSITGAYFCAIPIDLRRQLVRHLFRSSRKQIHHSRLLPRLLFSLSTNAVRSKSFRMSNLSSYIPIFLPQHRIGRYFFNLSTVQSSSHKTAAFLHFIKWKFGRSTTQ